MKPKIFRWIKFIIIIYCLVGSLLYFLQDRLLLRPEKVNEGEAYNFGPRFAESNISVDAETRYNIGEFKPADSAKKGIVLYFHGNRQNIKRYAAYAEWFTRNGYEVWMPDYPSFGKSTGELTEAAVHEEALMVYNRARAQYAPSQIIIYGKSFGTGVAAELASVRDCKRLILETPYYSLTSLARPYVWMYPLGRMMHFKMPVNEYLSKVTAPVTMFHGTDDGVIPYRNAKRLQKTLKPGDEFITIPDGSHNDLGTFPVMQKKLDSLLSL